MLAALSRSLLALVAASTVAAHTRSESHSVWTVDGPRVHMGFSVADVEAARITGDDSRADDEARRR